jgi:hypothetical protein
VEIQKGREKKSSGFFAHFLGHGAVESAIVIDPCTTTEAQHTRHRQIKKMTFLFSFRKATTTKQIQKKKLPPQALNSQSIPAIVCSVSPDSGPASRVINCKPGTQLAASNTGRTASVNI